MSLTVYEKAGSPRAKFVNATTNNGSSIEFAYIVTGTSSEIAAANAALAVAPLAYLVNSETLVRQEATGSHPDDVVEDDQEVIRHLFEVDPPARVLWAHADDHRPSLPREDRTAG